MLPCRSTWQVALVTMLAGCELPIGHAPCPCAAGWVCCEAMSTCVVEGSEQCSGEKPEDPPVAQIQRIQLDAPWIQDHFGAAVALAGDVAAVGAPGRDGGASNAGAVAVFERRGGGAGVWVRVAVLTAPEPEDNARFGAAVTLAGPATLLVGAPGSARGLGRVHVFRRTDDGWVWREVIEADVTGLSEYQLSSEMLAFGSRLVSDGDRVVVATGLAIAHVYDVAASPAAALARIDPLSNRSIDNYLTGIAIHGSTAIYASGRYNRVYVADEASGWAPTIVHEDYYHTPGAVAFDGQRLAIAGGFGLVRILERGDTGWTAPIDVALSSEPRAAAPVDLAWHGGELIATTQLSGISSRVGLERIRSIAGAWQADPIIELDRSAADWSSLATSGDRVLFGFPYEDGFLHVDATVREAGQASVFHLDATGYVPESTFAFEAEDRTYYLSAFVIASDRGHLLAKRPGDNQIAWFERGEDGAYQRRPSLVAGEGSSLEAPLALSGSHALVQRVAGGDPATAAVQAFELGDRDWVAGQAFAAPEPDLVHFGAAFAVDGDTAVIGAERPGTPLAREVGLVYQWSGAGWMHVATLDGPPSCTERVAVTATLIALSCSIGNRFAFFQRTDQTWAAIPVPVLPEPGATFQVRLSGDRAWLVTQTADASHVVSDVFRWLDGQWNSELHVQTEASGGPCRLLCNAGATALSADRMLLYRDPASVVPVGFETGAWREQPVLTLPPRLRSPDARIIGAALSDRAAIVSVQADGNELDPRATALYVFPSQ